MFFGQRRRLSNNLGFPSLALLGLLFFLLFEALLGFGLALALLHALLLIATL